MDSPAEFHCDRYDLPVERDDAVRTETMGGLDPKTWQTFCCPSCGRRLKTVFVGLEGRDSDR